MRKPIVVALALAAAGCNSPALQPPARHDLAPARSTALPPAAVRVEPPPAPLDSLTLGADPSAAKANPDPFKLASTRDLYLVARWRTLSGLHVMRIEVRDPNGNLYTRAFIPMSDAPGAPEQVKLPSMPHPIAVRRAKRPRQLEGVFRLALAGTPIAGQAIVGAWSFQVFIDQAQTASGEIRAVLE